VENDLLLALLNAMVAEKCSRRSDLSVVIKKIFQVCHP
jgi:hypothetical protein